MEVEEINTASELVQDGEWVDNIPDMGDVRLRVRSLLSPRVVRGTAQAQRRVIQQREVSPQTQEDVDLTDEEWDLVDAEVLRDHVLVDWDNITRDGEKVLFSRETAESWLRVPLFEVSVRFALSRVTERHRQRRRKTAGNSKRSSGRKSRAAKA